MLDNHANAVKIIPTIYYLKNLNYLKVLLCSDFKLSERLVQLYQTFLNIHLFLCNLYITDIGNYNNKHFAEILQYEISFLHGLLLVFSWSLCSALS